MTDGLKQNPEILLPALSPAAEALETAKFAWGAAMARCAAAHRAAVANLDQSTDLALRELVDPSEQPAAGETRRALLLARMDDRVLALAEVLQQHGLLRILDAATAVDAVSRAAATATVPDPAKTPGSK
jgi:hypothetical protein